jgi:dihydrofolate reductase
MHASLDGFVEGPDGEMDSHWVDHNEEVGNHVKNILSTADTVLWGRGTYQGMQQYWPSVHSNPSASQFDLEFAKWIQVSLVLPTSRQSDGRNKKTSIQIAAY